MSSSTTEYNPNKLGWGAAAVTVVGTLGLLFMAYSIHEKTYRHPRDPMNVQVYHDRDKAAEAGGHGEHGAAPAVGAEHGTTNHTVDSAQAAKPAGGGH